MPRPCKRRHVRFIPYVTYFRPVDLPDTKQEEECMTIEELESLRLKDLQGLNQELCAAQMNVALSTFQRILYSARTKVARALVQAKAIRIEGGNYLLINEVNRCGKCGHHLDKASQCPRCGRHRRGWRGGNKS